ncbi:hypothetical protein N802_04655 [Knoellia sinensis KCTC 19936]|uniref:DUF5753 domain-containing protein n=1 Tax=Knoellia sinensis KCTC 19936 TaxID=1385520 RepID=A0A0A0J3C4_9MICO|nr:hypothetical protein N802_04655 [Knoellia sinensis KCTC 19936]
MSRVETGRFGASLAEVADLLNFYGVPEEIRAELLGAVARAEGLEGAWVVRAGGAPRRQSNVQVLESRVRQIRQYQALWIPGLLQSPAYAAAVARAAKLGSVESFVSRRLDRQRAVTQARGVKYSVVLEEQALHRAPGRELDIMPAQMEQLADAIDAGWVDVRIRRTSDAATFSVSSFVLYDFREGPPVVLYEAQAADLYLSAPDDIANHEKQFRAVQREALDRDASRALVESMRRNRASLQG